MSRKPPDFVDDVDVSRYAAGSGLYLLAESYCVGHFLLACIRKLQT